MKAPAMAGLIEIIRNFWASAAGRKPPATPEVIIHDPSGRGPHDLDDPFYYGDDIQIRFAAKIAATGNRKTKNVC
jgi:hypothetical protein